MSTVLVGTSGSGLFNDNILRNMFCLRHKVFYERLRWRVNSVDHMECDDFDLMNPIYVVATSPGDTVIGCWRFLPTTGPYMLTHTFPELLRGEKAPRDTRTLEISRLAVDTDIANHSDRNMLNQITIALLRAGYQYAACNGISRFVAVTSVATERLLKMAGIPMQRFGDGRAQRIDDVLSVACWVNVNEQYRRAVSVVHSGYKALLEAA